MAETKKSTKSGFSAEERAAMKAAAAERKMAEKIDAIVRKHAPMLASKTYYGMPGWARDGKVCVFMQPASKFKVRYCTIGFDPISNLDDATCGRRRSRSSRSAPPRRKRSPPS